LFSAMRRKNPPVSRRAGPVLAWVRDNLREVYPMQRRLQLQRGRGGAQLDQQRADKRHRRITADARGERVADIEQGQIVVEADGLGELGNELGEWRQRHRGSRNSERT